MAVSQAAARPLWLPPRSRGLKAGLSSLGALALSLVVGGLLIVIAGGEPVSAYSSLIDGAFGSPYGIGQVLVLAVPLLIMGLGLALAFRGRVYNIGAEGQLFMGALASGAVAIFLPVGVAPVLIAVSIVAGVAAGAAWGGIVGVLRARWGVNEVISSLLLNYVAIYAFTYVIRQPLRDPAASSLQGETIPAAAKLPVVDDYFVHIGIFVALALVPLVGYLLNRAPF